MCVKILFYEHIWFSLTRLAKSQCTVPFLKSSQKMSSFKLDLEEAFFSPCRVHESIKTCSPCIPEVGGCKESALMDSGVHQSPFWMMDSLHRSMKRDMWEQGQVQFTKTRPRRWTTVQILPATPTAYCLLNRKNNNRMPIWIYCKSMNLNQDRVLGLQFYQDAPVVFFIYLILDLSQISSSRPKNVISNGRVKGFWPFIKPTILAYLG